MAVPFITHPPSASQLRRLQLYMSTFTDGSGYEVGPDGTTRPGWRDLERVVAEWLQGRAPQNKGVFDVIAECPVNFGDVYGISLKSKKFSSSAFKKLLNGGRVYMELCNSPAKLWDPLSALGIGEADFRAQRRASEIGDSILATVHSWYQNSNVPNLNLAQSAHLTISYSLPANSVPANAVLTPVFQVHTFDLDFPKGVIWRYKSARCLSGFDPSAPDEVLFDWYGLSGGQLKYYPTTDRARFASPQFALLSLSANTIDGKARLAWPTDSCWNDEN